MYETISLLKISSLAPANITAGVISRMRDTYSVLFDYYYMLYRRFWRAKPHESAGESSPHRDDNNARRTNKNTRNVIFRLSPRVRFTNNNN